MDCTDASLEFERQNGFASANHENSAKLPFLQSFILEELDIGYEYYVSHFRASTFHYHHLLQCLSCNQIVVLVFAVDLTKCGDFILVLLL